MVDRAGFMVHSKGIPIQLYGVPFSFISSFKGKRHVVHPIVHLTRRSRSCLRSLEHVVLVHVFVLIFFVLVHGFVQMNFVLRSRSIYWTVRSRSSFVLLC